MSAKEDGRIPRKVFAIYGEHSVIDVTNYVDAAAQECKDWRPDGCGLNWTRQDLLTVISGYVNHRIPFHQEGKKWVFLELTEFLVED